MTKASYIIWGQHVTHYCIWGPYSLRERNITKPTCYIMGLAFFGTKASSINVFGALIHDAENAQGLLLQAPGQHWPHFLDFRKHEHKKKTSGKTPRSLSGNVRGAETRPWSTKRIIAWEASEDFRSSAAVFDSEQATQTNSGFQLESQKKEKT